MVNRTTLALTLAISSLTLTSGCIDFGGCKNCKHHQKVSSTAKVAEEPTKSEAPAPSAKAVTEITSMQEFNDKVLKSSKPVVVDCNAVWCGACKQMEPVFHKIARELQDQYTFVTLDVDKVEEVSNKYGVSGIPTFLLFKDGKEVSGNNKLIGVQKEEAFKARLQDAFEKK